VLTLPYLRLLTCLSRHGHDFYILGTGTGSYTSAQQNSLNYINPPRRDVAMLPAGGWLVVAFQTDNPGAWLL